MCGSVKALAVVPVASKSCPDCGRVLPADKFASDNSRPDLLDCYCKECRRSRKVAYRQANKEKLRAWSREEYWKNPGKRRESQARYRRANPEKAAAYRKKYYKSHQAQSNQWHREYVKKRKAIDPVFKLSLGLRNYLGRRLRSAGRSVSAVRDLGCSLEELRNSLEAQFLPGMSWGNHGEWELDHIVPFSLVDLRDPEVQKRLVHHTNLRPLWKCDNLSRMAPGRLLEELRTLGNLTPEGHIKFPYDLAKEASISFVPTKNLEERCGSF